MLKKDAVPANQPTGPRTPGVDDPPVVSDFNLNPKPTPPRQTHQKTLDIRQVAPSPHEDSNQLLQSYDSFPYNKHDPDEKADGYATYGGASTKMKGALEKAMTSVE